MTAVGYQALRQRCALWQRSPIRGVMLTGEDRRRLLNGLVTCDVKSLSPGQGVRGFFTDVKGHILSPVVVRAADELLWLEIPALAVDAMAEHIRKYIVADRVEVSVSEQASPSTLIGPQAPELLSRIAGQSELALSGWGSTEVKIGSASIVISRGYDLGVPASTLWAPPSEKATVSQALEAAAGPDGLPEVEGSSVEVLRVEEGAPLFGTDYSNENLPQETGLDDAVSFSKGCYLGQEVVARLQHRGQVARRISRLAIEAAEVPPIGSAVQLEGREAGRITSAARSPSDGSVAAIAMLQRRALEPGTMLEIAGEGTARVL